MIFNQKLLENKIDNQNSQDLARKMIASRIESESLNFSFLRDKKGSNIFLIMKVLLLFVLIGFLGFLIYQSSQIFVNL